MIFEKIKEKYYEYNFPSNRFFISFFWYFFIVFVIGQFGSLFVIIDSYWRGCGFTYGFNKAALSGGFITSSTAILSSAILFVIKEYNSKSSNIGKRILKSFGMLVTCIIGLLGVLLSIYLLSGDRSLNDFQKNIHWIIYVLSILISTFWFCVEYVEPTAGDAQK